MQVRIRPLTLAIALGLSLANGSSLQTDFPPVFELSSLDGSTGFRLDGMDSVRAGQRVNIAGDINGDGIGDLIIGAFAATPHGSYSGSSYVVFGSSAGFASNIQLSTLDGSTGFRLDGVKANDRAGVSVSGAGDVNGDGIDDLVIGASGADPNGNYSGSSYVVFGKTSAFASSMDLGALDGSTGFRLDGVAANDLSGYSVAGAGDINGDGIDDLVIGAVGNPNGTSSGNAFIVFGKTDAFASSLNLSTLDGSTGFRLDGVAAYDYAGRFPSGTGDINGDGIGDLIIGAFGADPNGAYSGSSYVVFGKTDAFASSMDLSALDGSTGFRLDGVAAYDFSGHSVSGAGDINGDGIDDLIIGAYRASPNGNYSGSSYVVFGKTTAFTSSMDLSTLDGHTGFRLDGVAAGDFAGYSLGGLGDINGDGIDDLIIGADGASPNGSYSGSSYVVFGKTGVFASSMDLGTLDGNTGFRLDGVQPQDFSALSVHGAGDINNDGIGDLIIGAPRAPNGSNSGRSYLVFGRRTSAAVNNPTRGLYWDRSRNGQGFDLQRSGPNWFLLLYTYRNDNSPLWYLGTGNVSNGVFSGMASQFDYATGRDPKAQAIPGTGGPVHIDFTQPAVAGSAACNDGTDRTTATLEGAFHFDLDGAAGDWCVEPFQFGVGTAATDFTGSWFNSDDPGWGLTLYTKQSATPGGTDLVVVLYYYDAAGKPRWSLGVVLDADLSNDVNVDMSQFTGFCPTCTPVDPVGTMSGTMKLTLTNPSTSLTGGNKATINVDFLGAPGGQWLRTDSPIRELSDLAR